MAKTFRAISKASYFGVKNFLATYKKTILIIFIGIAISLLAYYLRLQMFSAFPPVGDTGDEVKSVFNGISLIKNGVPESWSWWDDYGKFPVQDIRGTNYRMVKPWFDEPPFFGLLIGGYAISKGMDSYEKVDTGALRWPMLKLGALNVFLLFILVCWISGFLEALVAGLVYATVPTIVLSSRLPLAENFLITFSLISLLFLVWYLKKHSRLALVSCSLVSGLAILVKQTGFYIPAALIFILFAQKKIQPAILVVLFAFFFLTVWFVYGAYYNWSLFIHLQSIFSGREIHFPKMTLNLFDTFRISEKTMSVDGWMIWGWISVVVLSFLKSEGSKKFSRLIPLAVIGSYLVIFAVMSGHSKGWYRFPFHPFLSWAIAIGFIQAIKNPRFFYSFFFIALAGFSSFISGTGASFLSHTQVKLYQLIFPLLMAPFLFYELRESLILKRLSWGILTIAFIVMIYLNIRTILLFQDEFWYKFI